MKKNQDVHLPKPIKLLVVKSETTPGTLSLRIIEQERMKNDPSGYGLKKMLSNSGFCEGDVVELKLLHKRTDN